MGIRFQCHHCHHSLHVKDYQAGKKGRCPECKGQFRIPLTDAEFSVDPMVDLKASGSEVSLQPSESLLQAGASGSTAVIDSQSTKKLRVEAQDVATESSEVRHMEVQTVAVDPEQNYELNLTQPIVITESPNATWYVRPASGGQFGPAPSAVLWQWLLEGRVDVDALVWREDWPQWLPASQVFAEFYWQTQGQTAFTKANASLYQSAPAEQSWPTSVDPGSGSSTGQVASASTSIGTVSNGATTSAPAAAKRLQRKQSRRAKYMIAIGLLLFLMIGLAIGLFFVLFRQGAGS